MKKSIILMISSVALLLVLSACAEPYQLVTDDPPVGESDMTETSGGSEASESDETSDVTVQSSDETEESGGESDDQTALTEETPDETGGSEETAETNESFACSLAVNGAFPQYVYGRYVIQVKGAVQRPAQFLAEGVRFSWKTQEEDCVKGTASISVFNDFDADLVQDPSEASVFALAEVAPGKDTKVDLTLVLTYVGNLNFPRRAMIDLNWGRDFLNMSDAEIAAYANTDILILDHSVFVNFPTFVKKIYAKNSLIEFFPYVDPTSVSKNIQAQTRSTYEIDKAEYVKNTLGPNGIKASMPGVWNGQSVTELEYYPGSVMINFTVGVEQVDSEFFSMQAEMLAQFHESLSQEMKALVRGYFLDNIFDDISWIPLEKKNGVTELDANYNGINDELNDYQNGYYQVDRELQFGMAEYVKNFHALWPNLVLLGNEGNSFYYDTLNGKYFEGVKDKDWSYTLSQYRTGLAAVGGRYLIWNNEIQSADQLDFCRTGFYASLIAGGTHACSVPGDDGNWYLPEYDAWLGRRNSESNIQGAMAGVFEKGLVLYNPTGETLLITLPRALVSANGAVQTIILTSKTGILLFYP